MMVNIRLIFIGQISYLGYNEENNNDLLYAKESPRSLHRWSYSNYYNYHGIGAKSSSRKGIKGFIGTFPVFGAYILSFLYVAIYWNNLHHLFHVVEKINGGVMWAQIHLLFWLSLIPFASGWMGENHFTFWPVILYGVILLCSALSYFILVQVLIKIHETKSLLNQAIGRDKKGKISLFLYIGGVMSTVILSPGVGFLIYSIVAILWLVPDKRIEKIIEE